MKLVLEGGERIYGDYIPAHVHVERDDYGKSLGCKPIFWAKRKIFALTHDWEKAWAYTPEEAVECLLAGRYSPWDKGKP